MRILTKRCVFDSRSAPLAPGWAAVSAPVCARSLVPRLTKAQELLPIIVGFVLSIGGMLVDALLVGLVADALAQRMDSLKHGLSKVLEENHTLILGWNDKVLPLIREIAEANLSEGGGVVVVMSEREKGEMEEEISRFFTTEDLKGTSSQLLNPIILLESLLGEFMIVGEQFHLRVWLTSCQGRW